MYKRQLSYVVDEFAKKFHPNDIDVFAGIESRGFILACALAQKYNKGMILLRKAGKLPGKIVKTSYALEYGKATLEVQKDVIKEGQYIVVHIDKEERGNKGAALTTFISLAGRYSVLMPNTARGGGISRKITNATSRRKLRKILGELEIPTGMGVIMRTAGMERNKSEIKRDLDYLLRAWVEVRELTLQSTAPTLVYEEANLIKRAIRDLYAQGHRGDPCRRCRCLPNR